VKIFNSYAQYYDLLYKDKDYQQETNYLLNLIDKYQPEAKSILEMGCGTGMHAELIAKRNFNVHGIDQSAEMVARAIKHSKSLNLFSEDQLSFSVGDIRSYRSKNKYDVVLSLFHVMSYQITDNDLLAVLSTVEQHLVPNGILIFDCWYGPAVLTDRPRVRNKTYEDSTILINRKSLPKLKMEINQVEVCFQISVTDKTTGKKEQFNEIHHMRYFFDHEIKLLIAKKNLTLLKNEEWLTGNVPDEKSWYVTYIIKRS
jgi:SAM-dependent methyltransferase